jgi:hypothetical protein
MGDLGKNLEYFYILYFGRPELELRSVELGFWWEVLGLDWGRHFGFLHVWI